MMTLDFKGLMQTEQEILLGGLAVSSMVAFQFLFSSYATPDHGIVYHIASYTGWPSLANLIWIPLCNTISCIHPTD